MRASLKTDIELISIEIRGIPYHIAEIPGHPEYWASTCGEIVSSKGREWRLLSPFVSSKGYRRITLTKGGVSSNHNVSRLVASAFFETPEADAEENPRDQVNHIYGKEHGDKLSNLEWVSQSENHLHAQILREIRA